jgi:hypothetical protein
MSQTGMEYVVAVLLDAVGTKRNYEKETVDEIVAKRTTVNGFLEQSV